MKHIAKIKNKSRFKDSARHKVPNPKPVSAAVRHTPQRGPGEQKISTPHDPEYYHSDNTQNRLSVGESEEAQSPHMHYEDDY